MQNWLRFSVLAWAFATASLLASDVNAQGFDQPEPYNPVDRNGVNLLSGAFIGPAHTISIGQPGQGGLSVTVNMEQTGWRHDMSGVLNKEPLFGEGSDYPWWYVTVPQGPTSYYQQFLGGAFSLVSGSGTFAHRGEERIYTAVDGTRSIFRQDYRTGAPFKGMQGQIGRIERPNGEIWTFHYMSDGSDISLPRRRLQSVTNNFGYQLHFEYLSNAAGTEFGELYRITALNNAVDACAPLALNCAYSQTWPTLTFTKSAVERTVSDALAQVTRYHFSDGILSGYTRAAGGQPVTFTRAAHPHSGKIGTLSDGAGTWTYGYTEPPPNNPPAYYLYTYVTDPLGQQTRVGSWSIFDGPPAGRRINSLSSARDPLLNETLYGSEEGRLVLITHPEGNREYFGYDDIGTLLNVSREAKPGSGLPSQVASGCASVSACGRPPTISDAMGNVTDYTYHPASGGVLTATGPAPTPGAPRPQTRYVWEQRYAWYKQNGSSAITQAPSPVWVVVEQSQCMTGATC